MADSRLTTLKVNEISLVDAPAVPKAKFLIAKRAIPEPDMTLEAVEKRVAPQGYTSSSAGATSPAHVHDYSLWLDVEDGGVRVRGWVEECCDHSHRFTLEGYLRGDVEASDGHTHALMTIKEAREVTKAVRELAGEVEDLTAEDLTRLQTMCETLSRR
jgi:hypothetical protein